MQITATQFRKHLFALMAQAMEGTEIWVSHKNHRIKLVPEGGTGSRLSGVTPLQVLRDGPAELPPVDLQREMESAWERDWSTL